MPSFAGLQRFSSIDFPGRMACVLFLRGCDAACFYCHNRALLLPGQDLPESEVFSFLEKRKTQLDGVVITGGEPTLRPELEELIGRIKEMGYEIKLDTNGRRPEVVGRLLESRNVDYFAVDIKTLPELYKEVCGADASGVRETIRLLLEKNAAFEARTTLYPGLDMATLKTLLASYPRLPAWRLNIFRMPELFEAADKTRLDLPAIKQSALMAEEASLRAIQPGLLLPQ